MKAVKSLILLLIALIATDWTAPSQALAKSKIPAACSKIKHQMVNACTNRQKSCRRHTNALNQCLKKSAYRPVSKTLTSGVAVCAMIYQPVCALSVAGNFQLFGNICLAISAGASEVAPEQCGESAHISLKSVR